MPRGDQDPQQGDAHLHDPVQPATRAGRRAPAAEAIAGGVWQVLHHYVANDLMAELPDAAPQLIYLALTPSLGPHKATEAAITAFAGG